MVTHTKIDEVERLSPTPEAQPGSSHSRPRPTEGAGARARASRSGTALCVRTRTDRGSALCVDLTRSPHRLAMSGICAFWPAGVDMNGTLRIAAVDVAFWRRVSLQGPPGKDRGASQRRLSIAFHPPNYITNLLCCDRKTCSTISPRLATLR